MVSENYSAARKAVYDTDVIQVVPSALAMYPKYGTSMDSDLSSNFY